MAQTTAPRAGIEDAGPTEALRGQIVQDVRVVGNDLVPTAVILNLVRTRAGETFDPSTVQEDYQRIFGLRKFADVEARVEPTETGVIVVFEVTEQQQIKEIIFRGNTSIDTSTLRSAVEIKPGESIDTFRIALARRAIENLYREKVRPFAHVNVLMDELTQSGTLVFQVVEGPAVRIRNIDFVGAKSFTEERLKKQIATKVWFPVIRSGKFEPETIEDDVAALRRYYESKGFFDVRVGRKLIFSPDTSELQIDFLIDEGARYRVDNVLFKGNTSVSEAELREGMRLTEGVTFDAEVQQRDVREMVRDYSPLGFIYQPQSSDPDYLRIREKRVFGRDPGTVDLIYEISEGKPFNLGRIILKGNYKTQDKVLLREMRMAPGQLYNSGGVQDAIDRLRGTPYFAAVSITPTGTDPNVRDLLVEVQEQRTATVLIGAGVNSNGGVGANITYEQRNFDIGSWPSKPSDVLTDQAFVGAGQSLRISLEPGTEQSNASVRFTEPWLFDQPYSFSTEVYYRDRQRRNYDDTRGGGRVTFGKRFNYVYSAAIPLRGEDVEIHDIDNPFERAPEIVDLEGHSTLTSAGLLVRRDTTNRGFLPWRGTNSQIGWDSYGAFGGEFYFQKFTSSWDSYISLYEDLLERRTILNLHVDGGYIWGDAPFFERYYGGGLGSVRGFRFRGISPRSGLDDDPVGGDFSLTGTAEVSFPLSGDSLRGVVFVDAGTVEEEFEVNTVRASIGAGIRLIIPFLGQTPIAIDLAFPLSKDDEDDTQIISFSLGFTP